MLGYRASKQGCKGELLTSQSKHMSGLKTCSAEAEWHNSSIRQSYGAAACCICFNQRGGHSGCCTGQHSTGQHSTAQHSPAQHSTAQHRTARHKICHFAVRAQHYTSCMKVVHGCSPIGHCCWHNTAICPVMYTCLQDHCNTNLPVACR